MSVQGGEIRDSREELRAALASGQLSEALAKQGQDILTRMERPLRLSVLGLPGSGKSTLMNLLLGSNIFAKDLRLPTISLTYGSEATAKCTLPNGAVQTFASDDLEAIAAMNPAYVELSMPLAALRKLSMMEVVASDNVTEQQRAVTWAGKRSDIALWCTQESSESEVKLWSLLPDYVQDHSFLMLTKADQLGAEGRLAGLVRNAKTVGAGYFREVLPVATTVALSARKANGTVDKAVLRNAGGVALISAVLREIDNGQRAANDAADIFLRQIDFDPAAAAPVAEKAAQELVATPVKLVEDEPAAKDKTAPDPVVDTLKPTTSEPTKAKVAAEDAQTDDAASEQTAMSSEARALCKEVVEQLTAEGEALSHQYDDGKLEPNAAIDVSVDTVTWLADYLSDNPTAKEASMAQTCRAANDAADLVQLIKLEKGDSVVVDALSLMVQLKHEIQSEMAA